MTRIKVADQRFSLKQWLAGGTQSRGLRKPGRGHCYVRFFWLVPFPMVNYPAVSHSWVLVYRVNQWSQVTKITEVKRNLARFIGGKFNSQLTSSAS